MGGNGSGGARQNTGPKRRDPAGAWLTGGRKRGPRGVVRPPVDAEAVVSDVVRPKGMPVDDAAVWDELAPFAIEQGTLKPCYVMAFADLCALIVLERRLRLSPLGCAGPDHRGLLQRVDAGRARFRLVPDGKPAAVEEPKDEWAEFDGPKLVKQA